MLRSLTRPVLRPLVRALTEARDFFDPRQLFSNSSTIGAIYAYDDYSYLYQKSDGSTPVTALEQPVGLVVDKRWGGARGSELYANQPSAMDNSGGGATVTHTAATRTANVTVAGTVNGYPRLQMSVGMVTNSRYVVTGRIDGARTNINSVRLAASGSANGLSYNSTTGVFSGTQIAGATPVLEVLLDGRLTGSVTVAEFSVRELPGLHAYQSTDAARPVLKGTPRYLNLDGTDDRAVTATGGGSTTGFLLVTGINVGGAGTARTIFSDRGTNTGYKVEVDAANNLVFTAGNGASFVSCTGPAITAGTSYVIACWHDGANLNIKVGSGAVTSQAFATASAGTAAISIGRDNGAATGFYNGRLYPTVYIKDSTAGVGAINATMAWVAGKGGIAL